MTRAEGLNSPGSSEKKGAAWSPQTPLPDTGLRSFDHEIGNWRPNFASAGFKPRKELPRPNASRANDITVGDAAARVLRSARGPMRLIEIVEAIERRGLYRTKSTHFKPTVAQTLARDSRSRRVRRGVYQLAD